MTPPAPDAYFTPWVTKRRPDGQLLFARGTWRDRSGKPLDYGFGHEACPEPTQAPQGGKVARP